MAYTFKSDTSLFSRVDEFADSLRYGTKLKLGVGLAKKDLAGISDTPTFRFHERWKMGKLIETIVLLRN